MKMAMLGGTFNPLHNGHINLARLVIEEFKYDKILFVPSYIPAHKEISGDVTAEERLHMLQISLEEFEWAAYSDCEINRKGVSYTVDTLEYLKEHYALQGKPGLIIGDDLAVNFHQWRSTEKILQMADLIIAHRLYREKVSLDFPHRYADNLIFSLSSSEIREKVALNEDITSYVPLRTAQYIEARDFYREETGRP